MRKSLIAPLGIVLLVGVIIAAGLLSGSDGGVRVQAGDTTSTDAGTTTTQTPVTTPVPTEAPTTAPTTVPVTEPQTTVPPPPPTDPAPQVPAPTASQTLAPQEAPSIDGPVGQGDPAAATRSATGVCMTDEAICHPPSTEGIEATPDWAACPQWYQLARQVGWPQSQMRTVMYVMHRESGCNPDAYNRSGATGLMQLLGWRCDGGCRNPQGNLAKALELWQSSGWCPWVLRGDPVTGRACG